MPTNDERREVAARLRNNADQKPSWVIPWAVFNDAYEHEGAELINRLADLIEPEERTCRNTSEAVVKGPFTCSACGEHSKTWYHMGFGDMYADVPNYCPNCGAKVVGQGRC